MNTVMETYAFQERLIRTLHFIVMTYNVKQIFMFLRNVTAAIHNIVY